MISGTQITPLRRADIPELSQFLIGGGGDRATSSHLSHEALSWKYFDGPSGPPSGDSVCSQIARSAGSSVQLLAKEGGYAQLRMPSGEIRNVDARCRATVGEVGNAEHELESWGKAGKSRWMGQRPKVRGEVMNPVDHPHGGRTRGGRNVVSPWGKKEGVKTRNKKKSSQRMIVRGRKRGKATQ